MKIVILSTFFSKEMGYAENGISRSLASLGHEVHIITSNLNVYGNEKNYNDSYSKFLGPADQGIGTFDYHGCKVHRLPSKQIASYILISGLAKKIKEINPDIIHCITMASLSTYVVAFLKPFFKFSLFAESHQHASVVRPELRSKRLHPLIRINYFITRTLPTYLASLSVKKCYAISPDCWEVANRFYWIPKKKLELINIGCDTSLFYPINNYLMSQEREIAREQMGYKPNDVVCIYTGRLSDEKNPLIISDAIHALNSQSSKWHVLFIGQGSQSSKILENEGSSIIPFVSHLKLPNLYRIADIGIWPKQESLSMLDASASGLPLILSDKIGDKKRIAGNGYLYEEDNLNSLIDCLKSLENQEIRSKMSILGVSNIEKNYSWNSIVKKYLISYKI
jgi:glycosyltransferase involved in cell wall biosynthesis